MNAVYLIALDQGTTSSRALLFDARGTMLDSCQQEIRQIYPRPGWVEHNPVEILNTQLEVLRKLLRKHRIPKGSIAALGITNQRETTVVWDKNTGQPISNAIVWQDKRTADLCERLKSNALEPYIRAQTGLIIDSYFSATKIQYLLDTTPGARLKAEDGKLCFGTIDTWLLWNLSREKTHATDYSNASRTMLYNINSLKWDKTLLNELDIPVSMMPEVRPSSALFGHLDIEGHTIPICGMAGDQQAALFGQACFEPGETKNTYGTGCFLLMNTGNKPRISKAGLITTLAWGVNKKVFYAQEGSIFNAGSAIQWLRDELGLIQDAAETDLIASQLQQPNPVYVVPAFSGLGAPYWDMYARGAIFGLTRDTGKNQLVQATLQSLAYQTKDLIRAMEKDTGLKIEFLNVDGGASANNYLMQFQANLLNAKVIRPRCVESTALGAANLAGLQAGLWDLDTLKNQKITEHEFLPDWPEHLRKSSYKGWKKAVKRTMNWEKE